MVSLRDHLISIQVSCQAEGRAGLGENQFRHQTMEAEQVVPVHSEDLRKSEASRAGAIAFRHPYLLLQSHRNQMEEEALNRCRANHQFLGLHRRMSPLREGERAARREGRHPSSILRRRQEEVRGRLRRHSPLRLRSQDLSRRGRGLLQFPHHRKMGVEGLQDHFLPGKALALHHPHR